ncbi:MAG: phosphate signaling complex protein PhoU [Acidobacteriota bacterium]
MEPRLHEELDALKQQLLEMAARVETNIELAVDGLKDHNEEMLASVIEQDAEVDMAELQIDETCIALLARQQPVGRDLRFIATALKIVKDLERVGDIAKNIAKHGLSLCRESVPASYPGDLRRMTRVARGLLHQALDAFVRQDSALARKVIEGDDEVDQLHRENVAHLIKLMIRDSGMISPMTQYLAVNKFLERIGDHSSNIAAMVVYMVEGRDIRHFKKQQRMRNAG